MGAIEPEEPVPSLIKVSPQFVAGYPHQPRFCQGLPLRLIFCLYLSHLYQGIVEKVFLVFIWDHVHEGTGDFGEEGPDPL